MKNELIYKYLNDDELLRISGKIKEMESGTCGEIRVSVKEKKPLLKSNKSVIDLSKEEFFRLNMQNTSDKTGILIFILLKEKQFHILADSGINEKVTQSTWDQIRDDMQLYFQKGKFSEGIILALEKIGSILCNYFPIKPDDKNELSNKVVF
jgi:uncharacterized membrane protein